LWRATNNDENIARKNIAVCVHSCLPSFPAKKKISEFFACVLCTYHELFAAEGANFLCGFALVSPELCREGLLEVSTHGIDEHRTHGTGLSAKDVVATRREDLEAEVGLILLECQIGMSEASSADVRLGNERKGG
jgi:hypothetical protein